MNLLESLWYMVLFILSLFAGMLAGNFFGESKAEDSRYRYLGGEK